MIPEKSKGKPQTLDDKTKDNSRVSGVVEMKETEFNDDKQTKVEDVEVSNLP